MIRSHMNYQQLLYGLLIVLALVFCKTNGEVQCNHSREFSSIAFVNVHVVPMDSERILENRTVVIQEGRIAQIGKVTEVDIPSNAMLIDGKGKYLMPGLCDMHTHIPYKNDFILYLANGITTVRNLFGFPYHLDLKQKIDRGEVLGPKLYTVGPIIDGDPPCWPGSEVVETEEDAIRVVRAHKEAGYDGLKVYNRVPKKAYKKIAEFARKENFPLSGHVPISVGIKGAIEAKQTCIEHLDGYWWEVISDDVPIGSWFGISAKELFSERPKSIERMIVNGTITEEQLVEPEKLKSLAVATAEAGVWNVPTLVITNRYRFFLSAKEDEEWLENPLLKYVLTNYNLLLQMHVEKIRNMSAGEKQILGVWYRQRLKIAKALHDAGARILLGTDSGAPFVIPGFSIHEELRNFVEAGLSPYEAIRAGTQRAAEFLNAQDEFGTIEVDKRADLILINGNPLEDISNVSRISGVLVRGNWLTREDLDRYVHDLGGSIYGK